MRRVEYRRIAVVALLVLVLTAPLVVAETPEPRDEYPEPLVSIAGVYKIRALVLDVNKTIEMAYTIRNLTYDLFQWEIKYNITAARVLLERGDGFLRRALELKDTAPWRAAVFAFVAAVHYSHAPALANPVLGRVIRANLGENATITEQTVQAVINVSSELRELLVEALEYAKSIGVDTSISEALLARGDAAVANATSLLAAGNVTEAFMYAIRGYRLYVRSYHALVVTTFAKYTREAATARELVEERVPVARVALEKMPKWIREHVRAKIEAGEIKDMKDIASELASRAVATREQLKLRERENLEKAIKRMLERHGVSGAVSDQEIKSIAEDAWREGKRGVDLAQQVLNRVKEVVANRTGTTIPIPTPTPTPRRTPTLTPTPPRR